MTNEIVNRVANSKLITIDLEKLYPSGERVLFDISPWLLEGIVLKETDFRTAVKTHNWGNYKNKYIALTCSTDAIIPAWAYLLVSLHAAPYAKKVVTGSLESLETLIYTEILNGLNTDVYKDKAVIIKGCANKPIPQNVYLLLAQKLQPVVKSIMYGEACSSVPLYKKRKS